MAMFEARFQSFDDRTEPAAEGMLMGRLYRPRARESPEYSLGHGPIGLTRPHRGGLGRRRVIPAKGPVTTRQ